MSESEGSRASPDDGEILRRHGLEPDPVIEAYKKHVDRTLLRENLRRTPEERWRVLSEATALQAERVRAGREARDAIDKSLDKLSGQR